MKSKRQAPRLGVVNGLDTLFSKSLCAASIYAAQSIKALRPGLCLGHTQTQKPTPTSPQIKSILFLHPSAMPPTPQRRPDALFRCSPAPDSR